jgi:hypothetical protein
VRTRKSRGHRQRNTSPIAEPQVRGDDLLPWADPYVTNLLREHRLQSAVNDSLTHLAEARQRAVANGVAWRQ